MNINVKRHKLLALLSDQYMKREFDQAEMHLTFDFIKASLKVSDKELSLIFTRLYQEEEAGYYSVSGEKGLYAKDKGVASFSTKKYLLENEKLIFERAKNWIQTFIPILSLLVTILVIFLAEIRIKDKQADINNLKNRVQRLELITKHSTRAKI